LRHLKVFRKVHAYWNRSQGSMNVNISKWRPVISFEALRCARSIAY
jgi:hypothetical protein